MEAAVVTKAEERRHTAPAPDVASEPQLVEGSALGAAAGLPLFLQRLGIQPKLAIGAPDDAFEREADRIAEASARHVATGDPERVSITDRAAADRLQRSCAACGDQAEPPRWPLDNGLLQRQPAPPASGAPATAPVHLPDPGAPLPSRTRRAVEPVLGVDLGHIRMHAGPEASEAARALRAKAFTHKHHIWLGAGQDPGDIKLMAHEAGHVVQQTTGSAPVPAIQRAPDGPPVTEDGETVRRRMQQRIDAAVGRPHSTAGEAAAGGGAAGQPVASAPVSATAAPEAGGQPAARAAAVPSRRPPADPQARQAVTQIDPAERRRQKGELLPEAKPPVDRVAEEKPQVDRAAQTARQVIEQPPVPQPGGVIAGLPAARATAPGAAPAAAGAAGPGAAGVEGVAPAGAAGAVAAPGAAEAAPEGAAAGKGPAAPGGAKAAGPAPAASEAQRTASLADQAFSMAASLPMPELPPQVTPPEPVAPVDAKGQPLPGNPDADAQVIGLAAQAQVLRSQGQNLRERAAEARSNVEILRGNLALVRRGIAQSDQGVQTAEGHLAFRRDLAMKAEQALQASEQKAETVAQQAPEGVEKAAEGKQQTGPMAGDARQLAAENSANTPDDDEAAENARDQGDKLNRVSSDTGTVDDAVTQAQNAAGTLVQDAVHAKQVNTQTRGRLDGVHQTLEQTGERLGEMQGQNAQARAQVENLEDQPDAFAAQAEQLDAEGQALIQSSMEIEARLQQIQQDYAAGMKSVPGIELPPEGSGAPDAELFVQRAVAETAPLAINLAEGLPSWLTGEPEQTAQQRREAQDREEQRRQAAIQEIYDRAGGDFSRLSAADKIDIALQQTGRNLFGGISNISWPGWGGIARGAGHLAAGLIDPRGPMMGVVSGLNMIVNGVASFVRAPSWGGLLKMAADIATGLTIILGSITALAGVIIAIMTAITILSFGTAAPVTGPIIAFCATVMSTVGGWTIAVGEVALLLQELVFLKNLYEAATAQTAEELQRQSDNMTADARAAGNVVLQMGMAKLAQVGGRNLQSAVAREGGGVAFARTLGSEGLPAQIRSGIREAGGVRAYAGEALAGARGAVAEAGGVGRYALGAGGRLVTGAGRTIRSTVRELTGEAPAGLSARQGFSREFLVGEGRPPGGAALAAEPRTPVVAEAPRVAEPAPPPRPAEAAPPPPERLQGGAPVDPAESQLLQGTRAKSGTQLSPQEVRGELGVAQRARGRPIHEGPYVEEVTLPNGHQWRRTEEGVWCRFSPGSPDCFGLGPSGPAPVAEPAPPAAPKPAPPGQQAAPTTVTAEPPTAPRPAEPELPPAAAQRAAPRPAERFSVSSQAEVQRLRANPPQRPANLDVEGQQLWEDYLRYYHDRLDAIERQLSSPSGRVTADPPRTWESYRDVRSGELAAAARGRAFQGRVTRSMEPLEGQYLTESDVGVSRKAAPGRGEVVYPDQLILDRTTSEVTTVSNKSRRFNPDDIAGVRTQVETDVRELIDKYGGDLYVRRPEHPLYGQKVTVREIVLVYDQSTFGGLRDLQDRIVSFARAVAGSEAPGLTFWVTFQ